MKSVISRTTPSSSDIINLCINYPLCTVSPPVQLYSLSLIDGVKFYTFNVFICVGTRRRGKILFIK